MDLDAFYASVEQLHDPTLRGRPVIVGGTGNRGVVAAASYEARRYGVHSAMPMARARRLCPDGAFLSPRFDAYTEASRRVHEVFRTFTPVVEPIALDEAFLDVAGATGLFGPPAVLGELVRARVRADTGLTASVGAATTKLLAKLASDLAKPDGMLLVEPGTELFVLHPLPVERLWGVGPATLRRLGRFGVTTVGDLAALPEETLVGTLGSSLGHHLHELAWNRDPRAVEPDHDPKSVGQEETFSRDIDDGDALRRECLRMADRVGARLRESGWAGRTIVLKVRFHDFRTITRSATLPEATDSSAVVAQSAAALLGRVDPRPGVRLLGVSVKNLVRATAIQQTLAMDGLAADRGGPAGESAHPLRRAAAERAVDAVRRRFGDAAVGPAALLGREGLRVGRGGTLFGPDGPDTDPRGGPDISESPDDTGA